MKRFELLTAMLFFVLSTGCIAAGSAVRLVTDRSLELTGFQDPIPYNPHTDLRNDFAMVYGLGNPNLPAYIQSWVERDYVPQMMSGIAWGDYQDFKDVIGSFQ